MHGLSCIVFIHQFQNDGILVPISSLRLHPRLRAIYGEDSVDDLAAQIKESGHLKPLITTLDHRIISGGRRLRAAVLMGETEIEIEPRHFADEASALATILLENATRQKTPEQRVREAALWKEIESEQARQRQRAGLKRGDKFQCPVCQALDETPVRHCDQCQSHSPLGHASCLNCGSPVQENSPARGEAGQVRDVLAARVRLRFRPYL